MQKLLFILACAGLLSACEDKLENSSMEDLIIGNWSNITKLDTIQSIEKFETLPNDNYAISFLKSGQLKEIKNSGWCGTPPISYGEFEGTWAFLDDSTLFLESTYWGGDMTMKWRIVEINNSEMSYYTLDHYYEDFE